MGSSRIESFRSGSVKSIENICALLEEGEPAEKVNKCVDAFHCGLAKMKTRMKHMIDVSDKYAVVEIFDTINILNKVSLEIDCQNQNGKPPSTNCPQSGREEKFRIVGRLFHLLW